MATYRLTPTARVGYQRILEYVDREFGMQVAAAVFERIESAFVQLAEHPGLGHVRDDISSDSTVLFWSVSPTLIAYRRCTSGIEILFVERAERDWRGMLE